MGTPVELAVQIALARKFGAIGFVGFCYQPDLTTGLISPLERWMQGD